MQVTFNTRKILPTSYKKKDKADGTPGGHGFQTTIFSPVQYGIRFGAGVQDVKDMEATMLQCAETSTECEIDFIEGRNQFGSYMEIYSVRPVKTVKTQPTNA